MNPQQARSRVAETFPQPFHRAKFLEFSRNLLNKFDESKAAQWNATYIKDAFKPHVSRFERLGTYTSPDDEKLDVLIVHLTNESKLERARTAIRNFVADHLKTRDEKDAALVAFVSPTEQQWRFSYVKMEYAAVETEAGRVGVETRLTPARRYSYIVGEGESCHTAQTRFLALLQDTENFPTLAQLEDAFSVEAVTKEFFKQYSALFGDINAALEKLAAKDKTIGDEFKRKRVSTVDFAKKLMGQIVFLYFIQKKGWLGVEKAKDWGTGPHNFLRRLIDQSAPSDQSDAPNFFNDILEPLFYDTLATDRGHEAWCKIFKCRIPFLNGGLFEPLRDYDWRKTEILLPNQLFTNTERDEKTGDIGTGVLDVFDRYNFTVNEAEPLEKEVAIDPEMLGKVFENLIEDNRRKGLGSFYTPREIVHYMCQESLINYLDTAVNGSGSAPASGAAVDASSTASSTHRASAEGLREGAQTDTRGACAPGIPRADLETFIHLGDQISHYEAVEARYAIKMPKSIEQHARLIDEKLADITVCDPAVGSGAFPVGMMSEIVRARSALTPYFNDVHDRTPYHFKRHAIQNCLYGVDIDPGAVEIAKLRLWLSLVVDEEDVKQIKPLPNLFYKIVTGNSLLGVKKDLFNQQLFRRLEELKPRYFDEPDKDKKDRYKQQIEDTIHELTNGKEAFDFEIYFSEVFHRKGGFDVVIGNPPYINIEKITPTERATYLQLYGEDGKLGKRYDGYQLFIMRGMNLIATKRSLAFIVPNTFLMGSSYLILRRRMCSHTSILALIDLPQNVFESATVDNVLLFLVRGSQPGHQINVAKLNTNSDLSRLATRTWDDSFRILQNSLSAETHFKLNVHMNPVLERLFEKMESRSVLLGNVTESSQGIILYRTEEEAKRNLHTSFQKQKGWKKLLRGRNIGYYCTKWAGEYVNYGDWLWCQRDEKFFDRPKLLLHAMRNKGLARRLVATFDEDSHYNAHNLANIIEKSGSAYALKYVLGIFNSALINFWYRNHFPNVNINPNDFRQIPVREASAQDQKPLIVLVDRILAAKARDAAADVSGLEREIDQLVYALYGLTPAEIQIVEGAAK